VAEPTAPQTVEQLVARHDVRLAPTMLPCMRTTCGPLPWVRTSMPVTRENFRMATQLVHTCLRVRDPEASVGFYRALGFEQRGRLNFDSAYNVYLGLPGGGDTLELTVNVGRTEPYDLGAGYNHVADLGAVLDRLRSELGVEPEKPPYRPGGRDDLPEIALVADPDGYRVELIDGATFETPQDPPHPSTQS